MCGIVGYTGNEQAKDIIINGLKKLEYRGYDSAGIAIRNEDGIVIRKKKGKIAVLEDFIKNESFSGTLGIGHTRWATHGAPSDLNAHPHTSADGKIAVVHNGIVENYVELRGKLTSEYGTKFETETDTEVIAALIGAIYERNGNNLEDAVYDAVKEMSGAYAIGVIAAESPDKIVAYRKDANYQIGRASCRERV